MNRKEIWMPILQDYCYEVKDDGQVRNSRTGRILKPKKDKGYERVSLYKDGKHKWFSVHRLVWSAFNGEIPSGMVIDHCDGNSQNNRLDNLRCVTQKENIHNHVTFPKHLEAIKKLHADPEYNEKMKKIYESDKWRKKTAETTRKACNKPVLQIDCNTGQVIRKWESASDVFRKTGIQASHVSSCCNGRSKSTGGFKWRFFMPPAVIYNLSTILFEKALQ